MAGKRKSRRNFGRVRKLPSGRFQARYPGPDGIRVLTVSCVRRIAPSRRRRTRIAG